MTTLDTTFADNLASSAPTPGGGGAAAYVGALAAALGSMVANLTIGKKTYARVEDEMRVTLAKLESVRAELQDLVEADARAFQPLSDCYRMPVETPPQREARRLAMADALEGACDVPCRIMERCANVLDACDLLAHEGSRLALSDAAACAIFAKAAMQAASLNVYINTSSMEDDARVRYYRDRIDSLLREYEPRADELYTLVLQEIR